MIIGILMSILNTSNNNIIINNIASHRSTPRKSSWIFSGIFRWIFSGMFQYIFTVQRYCPKDCHFPSGIFTCMYIYIYIYINNDNIKSNNNNNDNK